MVPPHGPADAAPDPPPRLDQLLAQPWVRRTLEAMLERYVPDYRTATTPPQRGPGSPAQRALYGEAQRQLLTATGQSLGLDLAALTEVILIRRRAPATHYQPIACMLEDTLLQAITAETLGHPLPWRRRRRGQPALRLVGDDYGVK